MVTVLPVDWTVHKCEGERVKARMLVCGWVMLEGGV